MTFCVNEVSCFRTHPLTELCDESESLIFTSAIFSPVSPRRLLIQIRKESIMLEVQKLCLTRGG